MALSRSGRYPWSPLGWSGSTERGSSVLLAASGDTDTGLGPATSAGETATWSPGQPCAGVSQGGRDVSLSVDSVKVSVVLFFVSCSLDSFDRPACCERGTSGGPWVSNKNWILDYSINSINSYGRRNPKMFSGFCIYFHYAAHRAGTVVSLQLSWSYYFTKF